jgi:hypothetical protein
MPGFLGGDRPPRTGPFGQLTIERRVLIVPGSTIPIAGIGEVSAGSVRFVQRIPLALAAILLTLGLALTAAGFHQGGMLLLAAGGAGLLGGLVVAAVFARTEQHCLSIASSGGQVFLFTGQRKTLEEARRLLTDKINAGDDSAIYRINFEKGIVHTPGHIEPLGATPRGPPPGPAPGASLGPNLGPGLDPGLHPGPAPPLPHGPYAQPGASRLGGLDLPMPAMSAPVPVLANGQYPGPEPHIDYAVVLPQIVDMQRFYAQRPDTQEIAERLNEMEFLMRSGTPTPAGRARVSQLAAELAAFLGAYPHVVQIFQQAARLAGA